jgi:hypothetical protein
MYCQSTGATFFGGTPALSDPVTLKFAGFSWMERIIVDYSRVKEIHTTFE